MKVNSATNYTPASRSPREPDDDINHDKGCCHASQCQVTRDGGGVVNVVINHGCCLSDLTSEVRA